VLVHLFSAHREIVLGMERFAHLVTPGDFSLTPQHFEKSRFLDIRTGDTFYPDFGEMHWFDTQIEEKYDGSAWVGDKRPDFYLVYPQLFRAFPDARVFFIYRDIAAVAASYQARARDQQGWPAGKDFRAAIGDWNLSMRLTADALRQKLAVFPVSYEDLFYSEVSVEPLFGRLGLEVTPLVEERIRDLREDARNLRAKRESLLTAEQLAEVRAGMEWTYYREVRQLNLLGGTDSGP